MNIRLLIGIFINAHDMRFILFITVLLLNICGIQSRDLPLLKMDIVRKINVDEFAGTDLDKIRKAIASIPDDAVPTEVSFEKRVYKLQTKVKGEPVFSIKDKKNIFINGNGADIVFTNLNPTMAKIVSCENIIVEGFNIDFDPLHFTQGEIQSVNIKEKFFIVKKDKGFPDFNDSRFGKEPLKGGFHDRVYVLLRDKSRTGMPTRNSANNYGIKYIEDLGNGEYKIGMNRINDAVVGDVCVLVPHKKVSGAMFGVSGNSKQVTLQNINLYGGTVAVHGNAECINLINFNVIKKPGTGRLLSICRDAFMLAANRVGPWLENCTVEANGDDGVNMHTPGFAFMRNSNKKPDMVTFTSRKCPAGNAKKNPLVAVSDTLVIYDMDNGKELQKVKVKSIISRKGTDVVCELDNNLSSDIDLSGADCQSKYAIFNINHSADGFVIRNCRFEHLRRYALFLLQAKNGIVEGCTFKQLSASAVYTGIEHAKSIGYGMNNVTFRNNVFDDVYVCSPARAGDGWIVSYSSTPQLKNTSSTQVKNIIFENNRFKNVSSGLFQLSNTDGFVIQNNTFELNGKPKVKSADDLILWKKANKNYKVINNIIKQ